jgi:predicted transcriptional regulator
MTPEFPTIVDCHVCAGSGRLYDDAVVGSELRVMRESEGVGLRRLARAIGWSPAYLSKLETGKQQWNVGRIALFARTLESMKGRKR